MFSAGVRSSSHEQNNMVAMFRSALQDRWNAHDSRRASSWALCKSNDFQKLPAFQGN
jgi:hypothetical protein